jgi:hypothetical protein
MKKLMERSTAALLCPLGWVWIQFRDFRLSEKAWTVNLPPPIAFSEVPQSSLDLQSTSASVL